MILQNEANKCRIINSASDFALADPSEFDRTALGQGVWAPWVST